jgi:hypothetical protein
MTCHLLYTYTVHHLHWHKKTYVLILFLNLLASHHFGSLQACLLFLLCLTTYNKHYGAVCALFTFKRFFLFSIIDINHCLINLEEILNSTNGLQLFRIDYLILCQSWLIPALILNQITPSSSLFTCLFTSKHEYLMRHVLLT